MGWIGPGNAESIAFQIKSLKYLSETIFLFFFCFRPQKIHNFFNSLPWLTSMELSGLWFLNTCARYLKNLPSEKMTWRSFSFVLLIVPIRNLQSIIPRGYKYSYHVAVTRTFLSRSFPWAFERTTVNTAKDLFTGILVKDVSKLWFIKKAAKNGFQLQECVF